MLPSLSDSLGNSLHIGQRVKVEIDDWTVRGEWSGWSAIDSRPHVTVEHGTAACVMSDGELRLRHFERLTWDASEVESIEVLEGYREIDVD